MVKGSHSKGKPKQPPVLRWALAGLGVFAAGVVTAMYLPGGAAPAISASSPTPLLDVGTVARESTPAPRSVDQVSATPVVSSSKVPSEVSSPSVPPDTRITIMGVGDILVHKEIWAEAQQDANHENHALNEITQRLHPCLGKCSR